MIEIKFINETCGTVKYNNFTYSFLYYTFDKSIRFDNWLSPDDYRLLCKEIRKEAKILKHPLHRI